MPHRAGHYDNNRTNRSRKRRSRTNRDRTESTTTLTPPTERNRPVQTVSQRDIQDTTPPTQETESRIVAANLFTAGDEYQLDGKEYIGYYHRHENDVLMIGRGRLGISHPIIEAEVLRPIVSQPSLDQDEVEYSKQEQYMIANFGQVYNYDNYPFPDFPQAAVNLNATHRGAGAFYSCPPHVPPSQPITTECVKIYNEDLRNETESISNNRDNSISERITQRAGQIRRDQRNKKRQKAKEERTKIRTRRNVSDNRSTTRTQGIVPPDRTETTMADSRTQETIRRPRTTTPTRY